MATKEEWIKGFRQLNEREPSVEEFLKAQSQGEIEGEEAIKENIDSYSEIMNKSGDISGGAVSNWKKNSFRKNKTYFVVGIVAIIAVIVIICSFIFINSRPKNIINDIKVEFSGYNKHGSAKLSGNYKYVTEAIIAKKVGYSSSDVEAIKKGNEQVLNADSSKYSQVEKYINDTEIRLNKEVDLSNGENIILIVKTTLKDSPIKSSKKSIKVSGLKKSTTYAVSDIIKEYPVKVTGYNHVGVLDYDDRIYTLAESSKAKIGDDKPTGLTNGDTVNVELSKTYLNTLSDRGLVLQGKNEATIKVSGLLDSPQIENLSDLLSQIDSVAKKDKVSTDYNTYTVTRQGAYFMGVNMAYVGAKGFSVVSIYKVDIDGVSLGGEHKKMTKYYIYGYKGLELKDNKINIASLTSSDLYKDYDEYSSAQEAMDNLKSDNRSLVKLN